MEGAEIDCSTIVGFGTTSTGRAKLILAEIVALIDTDLTLAALRGKINRLKLSALLSVTLHESCTVVLCFGN